MERRPSSATQLCSPAEKSAGGMAVLAASPAALTHLRGEPAWGRVAWRAARRWGGWRGPGRRRCVDVEVPRERRRLTELSGADLTDSCRGKP